jgi:hypothetical protein
MTGQGESGAQLKSIGALIFLIEKEFFRNICAIIFING